MEDEPFPPLLFDLRICPDLLQMKILEKMGPKTRFSIYLLCEEMRDKVLRAKYPRNQYNIVVKAHRSHYDYVSLNLYDKNGDQVFTVPITSKEVGVHLEFGVRNERIINGVKYNILGVDGGVLLNSEKSQKETLDFFLEIFKKIFNVDKSFIECRMNWSPSNTILLAYLPNTDHFFGIARQKAECWEVDRVQFRNDLQSYPDVRYVFQKATVLNTTHNSFEFKQLLTNWLPFARMSPVRQVKATGVRFSPETRAQLQEGLTCQPISRKITDGSEFFHPKVNCGGFDLKNPTFDLVAGVTFGTSDREEHLVTIYSSEEVQNEDQHEDQIKRRKLT